MALLETVYNPDILNCLANLSNDEVFTPPEVVNRMLDMLPQALFRDKHTTFLDPACKTGVFLREIAKRLLEGLKEEIPDEEERRRHIFTKQLYGIAITEMTSLLSRRGLYCSKFANGRYSIVPFHTPEGNIRFKNIGHYWVGDKCGFCGANKVQFDRAKDLEQHAYEFIHTVKPEEIWKMKFDVIIGNPPYQLDTDGAGRQARPIYNLFVNQAKKLNPRYISMIIPSRWFAGGMGLDDFRKQMISDNHMIEIVDFSNAKDCFPQNSISGGVCYFLWSINYNGECRFSNISGEKRTTIQRRLDEFPILVRYNEAVSVIHKVRNKNEENLVSKVSSLTPFGLPTNYRGSTKQNSIKNIVLYASDGITYISKEEITKGNDFLDKYKVMISKTGSEHAGEAGKDGKFSILTKSIRVLSPHEVCTHSYFLVGEFDNATEANNLMIYLKSKFVRFLLLLAMSSINLTKSVFTFVPLLDFSKPWSDKELYSIYDLSEEEISFIESMIRPMDLEGEENA